ncbi:hypothetical protein BJX70DRAFT_8383 [Aspergillus crustosus]
MYLHGQINYLESLPSQQRPQPSNRGTKWVFHTIPQNTLDRIECIILDLHSASLLLGDIKDQSPLRQGKPAPYRIFGTSQTINPANFLYALAVEVFKLSPQS